MLNSGGKTWEVLLTCGSWWFLQQKNHPGMFAAPHCSSEAAGNEPFFLCLLVFLLCPNLANIIFSKNLPLVLFNMLLPFILYFNSKYIFLLECISFQLFYLKFNIIFVCFLNIPISRNDIQLFLSLLISCIFSCRHYLLI